MPKPTEENVTQILSALHNTMQDLVDNNEFSNAEIITAILNFLVESTAFLQLDEKITLDLMNKTFIKEVRKHRKIIEKVEKAKASEINYVN